MEYIPQAESHTIENYSPASTCAADRLGYNHFIEMKTSIPWHPSRKAQYQMKVAAYTAAQTN